MNENITISNEEYRNLLIAEVHLSFILDAAVKAKYSNDVKEAADFIRSIRDPGAKVNDDAE